MGFGYWRDFVSRKEAIEHTKKLQARGYFVSAPEKTINGRWAISILTKHGKNAFYIKGL